MLVRVDVVGGQTPASIFRWGVWEGAPVRASSPARSALRARRRASTSSRTESGQR